MTTLADDRIEAWHLFLQAGSRVLEALEDELRDERGLSLSFYEVLLRLYHAPDGRMRMQQLAGEVLLSKSGLTRLVDRMVEEGLVERASCPTDRRGVEAIITDAGRARLREAAPVHLRGIREHFTGHLTESESRALTRALGKVVAAFGR